jgi:enamine deaminase RidA (YjgF/YER057c/UK114 family)
VIVRHELEPPVLANVVATASAVFTAGCIADDTSQDVKGQTRQALADVDKYLAMCGSDKTKILSAVIWLSDIRLREAMNEAWTAWLAPGHAPARACIEAKMADPKMLVEIMFVAAR